MDIQVVRDLRVVAVKSKDYYWYSPILKATLQDKVGQLVVIPQTEADILNVAKACAARPP